MTRSGGEAAANPSRDLPGWLARRGSLAAGDQAVTSLTGMFTHIWLARTLTPLQYGTFAASQAVFGFVFDGFNVVFCEPMMVLAPGRFLDRQGGYLSALLRTYSLAALLVSTGGVLCYPLLSRVTGHDLAIALLAMSLAAPGLLVVQLVRRICSARFQLKASIYLGLASFGALLIALLVLRLFGFSSIPSAYAALGSGATIVGTVALFRMKLLPRSLTSIELSRAASAEHRRWAIWGVPNVVARWFPINAYYLLIPTLIPGGGGLAATAQLRVVMTLIMPMIQLQGALSSSLLSTLASHDVGRPEVGGRRLLAFVLSASSLYALSLLFFGAWIVPWVFGRAYAPDRSMIAWAGVTLVASGAASVLRTTLLAAEQPRLVFWMTALSAGTTLTLGLWLTVHYEGVGAALGMAIASTTQALGMLAASFAVARGRASTRVRSE